LDIVCFDQIDTLLANSVEKRLYPQLLQWFQNLSLLFVEGQSIFDVSN
jgi:hypothetical protein